MWNVEIVLTLQAGKDTFFIIEDDKEMTEPSYFKQCLSDGAAEVKQGKGRNIIPPPERMPLWRQYLLTFRDPLIIVLLVVFVFSLCVSLYEYFYLGSGVSVLIEPVGVAIALLLATGIGFIFEARAAKEFDILNTVKNDRAVKVYRRDRHGSVRLKEIKKQDVCVGDVVRLEGGDEVPADGLLLRAQHLSVDESMFTGEPVATKSVDGEDEESAYPVNQLLRGSTVIDGVAVYSVTHVGVDTEEGRGIARSHEGSDVKTPLNQQLGQLGTWISRASFLVALLIVVGRMIYFFFFDGNVENNGDVLEIVTFGLGSLMLAVTLIVVAVPEGLPMSVTLSLAMSMRRMLKSNNLVRRLHACETMGAATVICTDKTGTLTRNQMTVVEVDSSEPELMQECMAICSTAAVNREEDGRLTRVGNPTECALLVWLADQGKDYATMRRSAPIIDQLPFSTERKYMETTVKTGRGKCRYVKGAPEIVMQMCGTGEAERERVNGKLSEWQRRAMRTLAFAVSENDGPLRLTGVVGIADPVRDDVAEAIRICHDEAGVRVIIVTGDTPGTANEIGRQVGLLGADEEWQTTTGAEFAAMSDEEALALVGDPRFKIISRARPDDKARLVTLLQRRGEIVAVTGDGTNDAPALSKAQVGLSMGDGTARAKEASDITIIDNSFSSINKAILWGRSLYQNIRRFILYQMTINICACLIVLTGAFMGLDSPLNVTQMLWVNLIMDTFAAMALSSLPPDPRVMHVPPRSTRSHIIDRGMACKIASVGLLFFLVLFALWQYLWHHDIVNGEGLFSDLSSDKLASLFGGIFDFSKSKQHIQEYELGIFFSVFVMMQFWNLFNARYFRTGRSLVMDLWQIARGRRKWGESFSIGFVAIALFVFFGQILIVNYFGSFFHVSALSASDWITIIIITSPVLVLGEVWRLFSSLRSSRAV